MRQLKHCISEMRFAEGENGENPIPSGITVAEFQQGFCRIAKKNSLSPSGRHIGHYKAFLKDNLICMVYSNLSTVLP